METRETENPLQDVLDALETEPHLVYTLERNRGWMSLRYHIEERRASRERKLMHAILKSDDPVDQRRVDYLRGYFDAMDWMISLPARMGRKLKEEEHAE